MTADEITPATASARPAATLAIIVETGLDEDVLHRLVHTFYARVRVDAVLGPIWWRW